MMHENHIISFFEKSKVQGIEEGGGEVGHVIEDHSEF